MLGTERGYKLCTRLQPTPVDFHEQGVEIGDFAGQEAALHELFLGWNAEHQDEVGHLKVPETVDNVEDGVRLACTRNGLRYPVSVSLAECRVRQQAPHATDICLHSQPSS